MDGDFMEVHQQKLVEKYQQRIAEIQDVSDTIAIANLQLNKLLQRSGWSRQSLLDKNTLSVCPVNKTHQVKEENLKKHAKLCVVRSIGINSMTEKNSPVSPSFAYSTRNIVSPIFIDKQKYAEFGVTPPCGLEDHDTDHTIVNELEGSAESLIELDNGINEYRPCDPLDELRFIYSWSKIPRSYIELKLQNIDSNTLKTWMTEQLKNENQSKHICKHITTSPHPDMFMNQIKHVLNHKEITPFVLKLWKFVAAKNLCSTQQIPEHTRNEFEFYGTTMVTNKKDYCAVIQTLAHPVRVFFPMDWVFSNLTREQKLQCYMYACQAGSIAEKSTIQISELAHQSEEQLKVLTAFEASDTGEKTHMEVMAELRDYKRRRQSYRGKNKSTKKMSGVEVIRELVEQQMLYLKILQNSKKASLTKDETIDKDAIAVASVEDTRKNDDKYSSQSDVRDQAVERNIREMRSRSRERSRGKTREEGRHERRQSRRDYERSRNEDVNPERRRSDHRRNRSRERRCDRSRESRRRRSRERRRSDKDTYNERTKNQCEVSNVTYYGDDVETSKS